MTPGPSLQELIETVQADAAGSDDLAQLAAAARTAADLEEVADGTLTHFVDQCRRNGRSWSEISKALGVTKQAVHKRFSTPTFERFTVRARGALKGAAAAATRLRHNYVGTEHVLLGLFAEPEGIAAKVLVAAGLTGDGVEAAILALTPRGDAEVGAPPFTPRAAACLEKALDEALQLGHNYVGTEHILLGLFTDPDGFAARIMRDAGVTHDATRDRIVEMLTGIQKSK
jgi:AcrR family transcriptional regulator